MTSHAIRKPQPRPEIMAIDPYVPGKSHVPGVDKVHKLSSNESPLGPSRKAVEAVRALADRLELYPDGASTALREAIGRRHGLDPARIICGNGSDELLALLAHVFLHPGEEGLYSQYGFLDLSDLHSRRGRDSGRRRGDGQDRERGRDFGEGQRPHEDRLPRRIRTTRPAPTFPIPR